MRGEQRQKRVYKKEKIVREKETFEKGKKINIHMSKSSLARSVDQGASSRL